MNRRTLYLLAGAGIVGLLYFGDAAYRTYVEAPASKREKELGKVVSAISKANDLIAEKLSVEKQLDAYERMSLPYDPEVTRTRYQGWLLEQVKSIGFTNTSIDASQPRTVSIKRQKAKKGQSDRKPVLVRYSYSLRCRGSLLQVVDFLFRFYRSGHLHKIRSITLNPSGGGAVINSVFAIEALGLLRTERESELTTAQVNRLNQTEESYYTQIARRNFFSKTGDNILNQVRVTGITFGKSGKPQVWLKTSPSKPTQVFHNDEFLELESHRLEVLDIQSELVLFLVDGKPKTVKLGQTIESLPQPEKPGESQLQKVPTPDAPKKE